MATVKRFDELKVWELARELCQEIYTQINSTDLSNDYALRNQINRSSGSVMDNIAEGYERGGKKEFIQYLFIAKASCGETRSQIYRAADRNYISPEISDGLIKKCITLSKKLSSLINYLKQSEYTGNKFQEEQQIYETNSHLKH